MSTCLWCDQPATDTIVVDPAFIKVIKGIKTVVHPERTAPVCELHAHVQAGGDSLTRYRANKRAERAWAKRQERLC